MHQLTIDTSTVTITEHDGVDAARAALHRYVVDGDYYLRSVDTTGACWRYDLLRLDDQPEPGQVRRDPRVAGTATIECSVAQRVQASRTYGAEGEAQRCSDDAARNREDRTRLFRSHPVAALTRPHFTGARPDPTSGTLRNKAITTAANDAAPAQLAAAVQQQLPVGTSDSRAAALAWYYALCLWGPHT